MDRIYPVLRPFYLPSPYLKGLGIFQSYFEIQSLRTYNLFSCSLPETSSPFHTFVLRGQEAFTVGICSKRFRPEHQLSLRQQPDDSVDETFTHMSSSLASLHSSNSS